MSRLRARLGELQKKRQLIELQLQIAEEERLLKEAEDRLKTDASRSSSAQPTRGNQGPPVQDTNSMVAAFIDSVVSPSGQTTPGTNGTVSNGHPAAANNIHPARSTLVASAPSFRPASTQPQPAARAAEVPKQNGQLKQTPPVVQTAKRPAAVVNGESTPPAKIQKLNAPAQSQAQLSAKPAQPAQQPAVVKPAVPAVQQPVMAKPPVQKPAAPAPAVQKPAVLAPAVQKPTPPQASPAAAKPAAQTVNKPAGQQPKPIPVIGESNARTSNHTPKPSTPIKLSQNAMAVLEASRQSKSAASPAQPAQPAQLNTQAKPAAQPTPVAQKPATPAKQTASAPPAQNAGQANGQPNRLANEPPTLIVMRDGVAVPISALTSPQQPKTKVFAFPPPPPMIALYRASKWDECQKFVNVMEDHFARHPAYYKDDATKIELGGRLLTPEFRNSWTAFSAQRGPTWKVYILFLSHALARNSNPKTANMLFDNATQFANQPVRHFALWLAQWEQWLPDRTPENWKMRLLSGVLPSVRIRATRPTHTFQTYEGYMMYLQAVEVSIPERKKLMVDLLGTPFVERLGVFAKDYQHLVDNPPPPAPQVPRSVPQGPRSMAQPPPKQEPKEIPKGPKPRSPSRPPRARSPSRPARARSPSRHRRPHSRDRSRSRDEFGRSRDRFPRDRSRSRYPRDYSRPAGRRSPSRPDMSRRYRSRSRSSWRGRSRSPSRRRRSPSRHRGRSPSTSSRYRASRRSRERTPPAPEPPVRGASLFDEPPARKTPAPTNNRLAPKPPPRPPIPNYHATSWMEFRNFTSNIEVHFGKSPLFYNDYHKIESGKQALAEPLLARWNAYADRIPKVSWLTFCTFLVQLLPPEGTEEESRKKYCDVVQKPSQPLRQFVFLMLRYAKCWNSKGHNRLRHLWERLDRSLQNKSKKSWQDFEDFHDFVTYLESVEADTNNGTLAEDEDVEMEDTPLPPIRARVPLPSPKPPKAREPSRPPPRGGRAASRPPPRGGATPGKGKPWKHESPAAARGGGGRGGRGRGGSDRGRGGGDRGRGGRRGRG